MREQNYDFWDSRLIDRPKTSNKMKVLDFKKVAEIIANNSNIRRVEAGLLTDWNYTSVNLYKNGTVLTDMGRGYLGSILATPAIIIEYKDGDEEEIECFVEADSYDSKKMWCEDSLEIFKKANIKIDKGE